MTFISPHDKIHVCNTAKGEDKGWQS